MKIAKTAPDALKILWSEKFFMAGKNQKEVDEELHKKGYNFGDATRKALERAGFLLVEGKHGGKKFIQKYPFSEENIGDGKQRHK